MAVDRELTKNIEWIQKQLPLRKSYDLTTRYFDIGGQAAFFVGITGFCDMDMLQKIVSDLEPPENELVGETKAVNRGEIVKDEQGNYRIKSLEDDRLTVFFRERIGYVQASLEDDMEKLVLAVLTGQAVLFIDGYEKAVLLDVRDYPERSPQEPDTEFVMGGAQDGFVENLLTNTSLIRRRIRSEKLIFERMTVGKISKTDVSIAYLEGEADEGLLAKLRNKISSLQVTSLTMGARSLEELLLPKSWFHPLPVIQSTQRPDTASSYLMEGHILLFVDNSPMVLIFPCSVFQFTQAAEDYYKSPVVGSYFRLIRFVCILMAMFLLPVFLLCINTFPEFALRIHLIQTAEVSNLENFIYVLAMEFGLDLFRYSSMHASSRYSGPLSIIGGLIAGDVAIRLSWATEETVFYAAVTLLATIALASIEFGEGIRLYRMFLILATGISGLWGGGLWGFSGALLLIIISVATTPTFGGYHYLWPLLPFEWPALKTLLFRYPTSKAQPSRIWKRDAKESSS